MPGTVRAPHEKFSIMLVSDRGLDLSRRQFLLAAGASGRRRVFISGASGAAHRRRQARIVFPEVGSARRTGPWRVRSRRLDRGLYGALIDEPGRAECVRAVRSAITPRSRCVHLSAVTGG
jgi:hypothetical protein